MFQAALLAFKNKKDNELVEQIENGVLNNNGSSSSYFTKSAPNLNNYENDDGGENLDNAGQQQPLHGWKLIRKTVVLNQPGAFTIFFLFDSFFMYIYDCMSVS